VVPFDIKVLRRSRNQLRMFGTVQTVKGECKSVIYNALSAHICLFFLFKDRA
jgi:hypothetical protein